MQHDIVAGGSVRGTTTLQEEDSTLSIMRAPECQLSILGYVADALG